MLYFFLALLFSLLVATFAIQNSAAVTVAFITWSFQTSLVLVILGSATFGALTVLSLAALIQIKARWVLKRCMQRQGELEAEVSTLKSRLCQETAKEAAVQDEAQPGNSH
ncbi:MAG: LapA family protein [Negativicutes bacterium]|nr:LapA family protein [Negativicutes bacterium]